MISAMPAVAVRRGRRKSKTFGRFGLPPSHHSSLASLSKNRGFAKRAANQSISTISSTQGGREAFRRRYAADEEAQRQRRRFLIYLGTIFLITGLLLVFIGVGAGVSTAQTVGLLLIGIGAVLCIIKVFCSEAQAQVPKPIAVHDTESGDSGDNVAASSDNTPVAENSDFTAISNQQASPTQEANNATTNSHQNDLTPTSLNSIPETQVLITDDAERF